MSDWGYTNQFTPFPHTSGIPWYISPVANGGGTFGFSGTNKNPGSYPSANLIMAWPLRIVRPLRATAFFWTAGGSAGGNFDIGLYNVDGSKIVSTGSTAQTAGSDTPQIVSVTPFTLVPGNYYLAWTCDSTSVTMIGYVSQNVAWNRARGARSAANAFPLPSTLTWTAYTSNFVGSGNGILCQPMSVAG